MSEPSVDEVESKVVRFNDDVTLPGQIDQDIVELLREMLAEAERGEILALACATLDVGGSAKSRWRWTACSTNGFALMGVVSRLLYRLNQDCEPL